MIHHVRVECKCGFKFRGKQLPDSWGPTLARIIAPHVKRNRWHGPPQEGK